MVFWSLKPALRACRGFFFDPELLPHWLIPFCISLAMELWKITGHKEKSWHFPLALVPPREGGRRRDERRNELLSLLSNRVCAT